MIDHHIDEEMILRDEVSDEAVEAAAALVALGGLPTLPHTYCFACPSDGIRREATQAAHLPFDPSGFLASEANQLARLVAAPKQSILRCPCPVLGRSDNWSG
jgi:hypothetical protein